MISAVPAAAIRETVRSRRGMSLVELLIAIPIIVIIGVIVVSLFVNYLNLFIANNDVVAAGQRADMVFRLLHEPVVHAGIGIDTTTSDDFKNAWGGVTYPDAPFPAEWGDAIILSGDEEAYSGIGILYAVPTGMTIKAHSDMFSILYTDGLVDMDLINHNLPNDFNPRGNANKHDLRAWLTLPGTTTSAPMLVTDYRKSTQEIQARFVRVDAAGVSSFSGLEIHDNQELYQMRAVMAYVRDNTFHMAEITNDRGDLNYVTTIDRVRAVRFKLSDDRKYLDVRVLVMGDSVGAKHTQTLDPGLRARWEELTNQDVGHYFEEFSTKWRVRNLVPRS